MLYNRKGEPVGTWRWLMYADGPLAGRTCLFGWYLPEEIPERVTAVTGWIHCGPNRNLST